MNQSQNKKYGVIEGATFKDYSEEPCQTLAKQNQNNIESLQQDVKKLLNFQTQIDSIKGEIEGNKKQLSALTDQVYKMPD